LTKASIDLRRGGVAPATKPPVFDHFLITSLLGLRLQSLIDNHPEHRRKCQNYQTEDHPQGEQFYTDALSVLALSAAFAPQHGERK
jgi:hypothetical protein